MIPQAVPPSLDGRVTTYSTPNTYLAQWTLPRHPVCVGAARTLVARRLDVWEMARLTFTAQLVVSELVTNALHHGVGAIWLRLVCSGCLTCEVHDAGGGVPCSRMPRAAEEGGRGLLLVAELARDWGVRMSVGGKTVWADIDLDCGSAGA